MSHLSVYGGQLPAIKQKAIEDAKKMQVIVVEECQKAGQEPPPYLLQELIGKGSFGRVYKASDLKTNRVVAVKIIDIEESDTLNPKLADTYSEFLKEINALKLLSEGGAKNINHVLDALPVGQSMWMVTEHCAGGSVATLMKPTAPGGLQEKWIIPILREVAEAVFWVHKAGIIHRDIKCANVLITEAGGVQLCDFGVSGVIETKFDKRSTFIGTPHWMAPELFDPSASYGMEVDIWAFGSMVFEIASGLPPNVMTGIDITQLGTYLKQHTPRLEGDQYSEKLKDLVSFCLIEDPAQRPTIEAVQRHPYLFGTENTHPTSSLVMLVRAFRVWEAQGGSRKSLFALGGAQGPMDTDLSSTAMANDEWNFSTTVEFDRHFMSNTDAQAVYDVYGSQVDLSDMGEPTPQPLKPKRRRPPPNLPVMRAPLEKVFDPNTISNYEENARAYYGKPVLPPASDLPLRDNSHTATLRESLIDLDDSLHGGRLSKFVDMETIRAGPRRSQDFDYGDDYARPPNSDPEMNTALSNRKTQEWKFPVMFQPASANPEMSHFPFNEDNAGARSSRKTQEWKFPTMIQPASAHPEVSNFSFNEEGGGRRSRKTQEWKFPAMYEPASANPEASHFPFDEDGMGSGRPPLQHHHTATEPFGYSPDYGTNSLMVPRAASQQDNRASMSSLIDLDESLPEPSHNNPHPMDTSRPSTANSDVASDMGAFDLERHASYYPLPSTNREPSIYVSDASGFTGLQLAPDVKTMPSLREVEGQQRERTLLLLNNNNNIKNHNKNASGAQIEEANLYAGHEYTGDDDSVASVSGAAMNHNNHNSNRLSGSYSHSRGTSTASDSNYTMTSADGRQMPAVPDPPSERVMMGESGQVMREEFFRLLEGMTSHLKFAGEYVGDMPIRRVARGQEIQNGQ